MMVQETSSNDDDFPEENWAVIQETLYLLSIPGMCESIKEGMSAPVDECSTLLDWD